MEQYSKKVFAKLQLFILLIAIILIGFPLTVNAATIKEQFKVSDGANYKNIHYSNNIIHQDMRVMEVNLKDPYTSVEIGIPSVLNKLTRTTSLARQNSWEGHQVLGAINGSFFHLGTPMNLVAKDNYLVHAGEVFAGKDKYVNEPIAFGINANGKGIIDHYNLDMSYIHNNNRYPITSTNKERSANHTILYTSHFPSNHTKTNIHGTEVVVTLSSSPTLEIGSKVTGTVASVSSAGKAIIPKNGFVISAHGIGSDKMKDIKVGDSISLEINMDSKWKNATTMIASGPMLVKNGKVSMTMNPNSPNARQRAPRTAVAIDRTGDKVFFVTVDGRQPGYSSGMSLSEFAKHLVDLGADRALNLDGGGSTTMAVRYPGATQVTVANRPSDKSERTVSTILMAVDTEPKRIFSDVKHSYWASSSIIQLHKQGTISGYPDGTFRPENSITRSDAALMLVKELGLDTSNIKNPGFKDVKPTDKYYKEIAAVANAGLFTGRGNGVFAKDAHLTRGEMAVLIQRTFQIPHSDIQYFPDVKNNHYAYTYVNSIAHQGIAGGYADKTYRPSRNVSRAEFSTFLVRSQKVAQKIN